MAMHMELFQRKTSIVFTNCPLPEAHLSCRVSWNVFYWNIQVGYIYTVPLPYVFIIHFPFNTFLHWVAAVRTEPESLLILNLHDNQ